MPKVSLKRYRPGPRRRRELRVPGESVQVDVKHLAIGSGRLYQFTAIDEATRYRVLKIYDHNSIKSAIAFVDEVRARLPMAIQRIRTYHGSEFATDFTWHLHDLGITHRRIPRGRPEANGKVERSHRTDEDEFYRRITFRTPQQLAHKLRGWEHEYNHYRLHLALGGKTPAERLLELRISTPVSVNNPLDQHKRPITLSASPSTGSAVRRLACSIARRARPAGVSRFTSAPGAGSLLRARLASRG